MGYSTTPTYAVTLRVPGFQMTGAAWRVRRSAGVKHANGYPTTENLERYVADFEASTREGGVNAHLGKTTVASAWIIDQRNGACVAKYKKPQINYEQWAAEMRKALDNPDAPDEQLRELWEMARDAGRKAAESGTRRRTGGQ